MACHRKLAPSVHGACREKVMMTQEALSRDLSQVQRKGELGDEVDGMKGDAAELLNGDDGQAQERRALWFSQDIRSQLCQRVVLLRDFPRSGSAVGVKTDALVVSLLLVPWGVYCLAFSLQTGKLTTSLSTGSEERQKNRAEEFRSRSLLKRSSPQSMRRFLWPCDSTDGCAQRMLVERVYEQRPHDMSTTTYTTQPQGLALCSRCHPALASEAPQCFPARTPTVHWGRFNGRPWVARHQRHKM